jgi:hypothetical protein
MRKTEIKDLIISSLDKDSEKSFASAKLEEAGVDYGFGYGFSDRVLNRIFVTGETMKREADFIRNLNFAFRSIALSGVAAIIFLLISIFIMEGKVSFNSFLGLKDSFDESIVCLLTGN